MKPELLAPNKVEYIVVKEKAATHKILLGVCISLVIALIVVGTVRYSSRSEATAREFPLKQIPTLGLTATFRAKWADGSLHYIFKIEPTDAGRSQFLEQVKSSPAYPYQFTIELLGQDGYETCSVSPHLARNHDATGDVKSMATNGETSSCTEDQFARTQGWAISYATKPQPAADLAKPSTSPFFASSTPMTRTAVQGPPTAQKLQPSLPNQKSSIATKLTGSDFETGAIETLDQGSFRVSRHAEYMTLMGWRSGSELELDCDGSSCIVTDQASGESVHAKRLHP